MISNNVIVLTVDEFNAARQEAYERGRQQGLLDAADKANPNIRERIFRLKEALLLCDQAASGTRYAWEGSQYRMPEEGGISLGDRVNRVGEIVRDTFARDPFDEHQGNQSLAFSKAEQFYREHPDIEVRSWFGRLVREKAAKGK